jgi:hypothetical protein
MIRMLNAFRYCFSERAFTHFVWILKKKGVFLTYFNFHLVLFYTILFCLPFYFQLRALYLFLDLQV